MNKFYPLTLVALTLFSFIILVPLSVSTMQPPAQLMVIEWYGPSKVTIKQIPTEDNSINNSDYKLLPFNWNWTTAKYWINPKNNYGFSPDSVIVAITASAETWDEETSATVFSYQGVTSRSAGKRDNYNVISWGIYRNRVIAVTYIWYSGSRILESDTRLNTLYKWSLTGESGKMDVQNIMTHEFGHWCGLDDLYEDADYWLTMYGYSSYGETYKRTLGLGDILGLEAVYGP